MFVLESQYINMGNHAANVNSQLVFKPTQIDTVKGDH